MAKTGLAMEAIKLKECSCCGEEKEYSAFHKSKQAKDGLLTQCIACYRIKRAKFREVHKGEINARERKKHMMNRERNLARKEKWRAANPEKVKEMEKRSNDKRHRTIKGRLNSTISSRLNRVLHGSKAGRHWEDLVNFTIDQLRGHLEKSFTPGMNWENYGSYWVVDHKIPVAVFNYEHPDDIDFRICWSLKNLRPLAKSENLFKWAKIDKPFQPSLNMKVQMGNDG
jgi:hypothetical protein